MIEWHKHANEFMKRVTELAIGAGGALIGHWLTVKKDSDNQVVVDKDGKPVQTLDMNKIREHAPFFAKTVEEVANFNTLVEDLDPAIQKSLEPWMANLGLHQRSDLIIKIVAINKNDEGGRAVAKKALEDLATINPDVYKMRRAVALKLMKPSELDYPGAQLTRQASEALESAIAAFHQGKADWDNWATDHTALVRTHRQELEADRAVRQQIMQHGTRWQRMRQAHRRATAAPWERD